MRIQKYTLVQHSGYGYKGDPQFKMAVEESMVDTRKEEAAVLKVGGILFAEYMQASDRAEKENYPPEVKGLIPRVNGRFAANKVKGLKIYIPKGMK